MTTKVRVMTVEGTAGPVARQRVAAKLAAAVLAGTALGAAPASPAQQAGAKPIDYAPATVVIYNKNLQPSVELAQFYAAQRGVPAANLVGLDCPEAEKLTRQDFVALIANPLRKTFDRNGWWETGEREGIGKVAVSNRMRVITVIKGVPLKVMEERPPQQRDPLTGQVVPEKPIVHGQQNQASVDSELALLGYLDMPIDGAQKNRYYGQDVAFADADLPWMMLVGRIDAASYATARRIVTDAIETEKTGLWGKAYVDVARKTEEGYAAGEKWLLNTGTILSKNGFAVVADGYPQTFASHYPMNDAVFYFGWYSAKADGPLLNPAFRFRRGAIACHIHSYSAAAIGNPQGFWVSPLLEKGACAVLGNTWEPYLNLTHQLDLFCARILQGYSFGEAAHMAIPALSWMGVAMGDPLYRPMQPTGNFMEDKSTADYKALRVAAIRWGKPEELAELVTNLERAAENLNSGTLYEAAALRAVPLEGGTRTAANLEKAYQAYPAKSDKLRVRLHTVDFLRSGGRIGDALALLRQLRPQFADIPEVNAIDSLILTLDPPAPPPPKTGALDSGTGRDVAAAN